MSRSALWRQEANVKERERAAVETFEKAVEEGRSAHARGVISLTRDDTFNLNPMLLQNISKSPYFLKCCQKISDWNALVDEIYYEVKHLEPWTAGPTKSPSTAFCLLVRLFTLRCTEKQMTLMLNHLDSPYIRCIGFLYLRYASEPTGIWKWFEPHLYDEEPVKVEGNTMKPQITVGQYARSLLTDMEYHDTLLPRLPVVIERDIKVKLLLAEQIEQRAKDHLLNRVCMKHFQRVGNPIRALYGDDENPVTWYDAVVDRVILRDPDSDAKLSRPTFLVTFPEYGNTETVTLGELDMPSAGVPSEDGHRPADVLPPPQNVPRGRDVGPVNNVRGGSHRDARANEYHDRSSRPGNSFLGGRGSIDHRGGKDRGYGPVSASDYDRTNNWFREHGRDNKDRRERDRPYDRRERHDDDPRSKALQPPLAAPASKAFPCESKLMEEVLRREREKSAAKGKAYASRPATFKESLSVSLHGSKSRKRSHSPEGGKEFRSRGEKGLCTSDGRAKGDSCKNATGDLLAAAPPVKEKTLEALATIEEKKRKLMAKYG